MEGILNGLYIGIAVAILAFGALYVDKHWGKKSAQKKH